MAHFEEKNIFFIFVQFYCFEQKGLLSTNPNFPLDLLLFKLVEKKNFLIFSEHLSEIVVFLTKKRSFNENASKQQESIV